MKILVVEDSSASRILMIRLLKSLIPLAEISTSRNGKDALLLISSEINFDLIVLDLGLPDISGFQILDLVKSMSIQTPIITILDEGSQEALRVSLEKGAISYVTKPISKKQLSLVLSGHIKWLSSAIKRKILVVDDDDDNRMILKLILSKRNFEVVGSCNGFDAIRQTSKEHFDAILMDIRMPYMNGYEASIRIRKNHPHVPIIAITSEPMADVLSHAKEVGIDAIHQKPVLGQELIAQIEATMESKKAVWVDELDVQLTEKNETKVEKRNELIETFLKFIPKKIIQSQDLRHIECGLKYVEECSLVYFNIKCFNEIIEEMSPAQCFNFVNSYFEMLEPIVNNFGGTVHKFMGAGIVCTFPLYKDKFSNNALHAVISMQDQVTVYNRGRRRAGYEPIEISCGISTGSIAMGICGTSQRFNVGAFGVTKNVASGCQKICRALSIGIVVSADTYDRLEGPSNFLLRPLGKHVLDGCKMPVKCFEVFGHEAPELRDIKESSLSNIDMNKDVYEKTELLQMAQDFPEDPLWKRLVDLS